MACSPMPKVGGAAPSAPPVPTSMSHLMLATSCVHLTDDGFHSLTRLRSLNISQRLIDSRP